MVLDELVYDPATGTGSMAVDMVEGAFSFVSGEIAKTGPDAMKVSTPVATIGIRGTTVAGKAAVEGNENSFTLLQDADGGGPPLVPRDVPRLRRPDGQRGGRRALQGDSAQERQGDRTHGRGKHGDDCCHVRDGPEQSCTHKLAPLT